MLKTDTIINGDCLEVLKSLPDESIHCCVTSPPYYALRDYGKENQIGREGAPEEYIGHLVSVFCELKRVLRSDGTFWLNIADCYSRKAYHRLSGCKPKELMGLPWLLALTLRKEGWFLRSDIIWQKDNPMPESAKDRPSRCYEHIFLFTKSGKYFLRQSCRCRADCFKYRHPLPLWEKGKHKICGRHTGADVQTADQQSLQAWKNRNQPVKK